MHDSPMRPHTPLAGPILWVTLATADLEQALAAWQAGLNLRPAAEGRIEEEIADSYAAPEICGARWVLLGGRVGGVRLIEVKQPAAEPANWADKPLASLGWAAVEFSVADLDSVFEQAVAAGFRPLGYPAALGSNAAIRAGQVAVPGGGAAYLTDIRAYQGTLNLYPASQPVDRAFIAVLASADLEADRAWLATEGVGDIVTDREVKVPVLQKTLQLADDQMVRISSLQLAGGCLIEVDAYPAGTVSRTGQPGPLPGSMPGSIPGSMPGWVPGLMMVTLASQAPLAKGRHCAAPPYDGRLTQIDRLPSGALIERVAA